MDISARSYVTAGVTLLTACAIIVTPVSAAPPPVSIMSDIRLAVSPTDIEVAVDDLQAELLDGTARLAVAAGLPGQGLIGVVDNITAGFDALFTGLSNATSNPTLIDSFDILRTFAVDAWAMLAHNLTRINAVMTGATAQVGELLATALTGSLRNILVAAANTVNAPLSPASYAELIAAGIETGGLLVGNGLGVVRTVGDAGFDIGGVVTDELTFQVDNAVGSLGKLLTQLGDASGSGLAKAVVSAVRGLAFTPALAVFNFGSEAVKTVIATAKAGFDAVVGVGSRIAGSHVTATAVALRKTSTRSAIRASVASTGKASPNSKAAIKPGSRKDSSGGSASHSLSTGHSARNVHSAR